MKVIWEAQDIRPGRKYGKPSHSEEWMIGFLSFVDGPQKYVSISMVDGMITPPMGELELAKSLTESGYVPVEILGR